MIAKSVLVSVNRVHNEGHFQVQSMFRTSSSIFRFFNNFYTY